MDYTQDDLDLIGKAADLAAQLHAGQTDKNGRPYLEHPRFVSQLVRAMGGSAEQQAAAWLHDAVEDTAATPESLKMELPEEVVQMVVGLSHVPGQPYDEYIRQISKNPELVTIKLADLYHNMDPARLHNLDGATRRRLLGKYLRAVAVLSGVEL